MQYQSFPGVKGGSKSLQKLAALRLPSLVGKRFLDVGCNEGFFCGYALFNGASQVVGMDKSITAIRHATIRFPEVEFIHQSWDNLPQGPFDVITLLSALHYAEDQADLIHRLMDLLADDGLLVLEISMAPGIKDDWVKVTRSIDERYFPTRNKLGQVLKDFAWKVIGHSIKQGGDPLQRYVVHIRKLKPYVWLLLQNSGSGKSTIGRRMFGGRSGVPVISGDRIYLQISQGKFEVSQKLRELVSKGFTTTRIARVTRRVQEHGLVEEMVQLWASQAGFRDFVLDSYVPRANRQQIKDTLHSLGYFPVEICWDDSTPITTAQAAADKANDYEAHLEGLMSVSPADCVRITKLLKHDLKPLIRWHLDSPAYGGCFSEADTFRVAGWLIATGHLQAAYEIYVSGQCGDLQFKPQKVRGDVLRARFGSEEAAPPFWRSQPCGFSFNLSTAWLKAGFELSMLVNGERIPLAFVANESSSQRSGRLKSRMVRRIKHYRNKLANSW